jgi:hypothetical protein
MGQMTNAYKNLVRKSEETRPLGRPGAGRRIILKWIFKKQGVRVWTAYIWIMIGAGGSLL